MQTLYFEDFHAGQVLEMGEVTVSKEEIIAFARQYDPQPFHIDSERAKVSAFGGLIASGWHTVALLMRLMVDGMLNHTVSMGSPGVKEIRWLKPVRPGDTLQARLHIVDCTPSKSRPNMGVLQSRSEVFNQHGEVVMTLEGTHFLGRRPEGLKS
jgi:acyl dehydratase